MQYQILITTKQLLLIKKAFSNNNQSLFSEEDKEEMKELSEVFDYIIEENDTESLHDLSY